MIHIVKSVHAFNAESSLNKFDLNATMAYNCVRALRVRPENLRCRQFCERIHYIWLCVQTGHTFGQIFFRWPPEMH